MPGPRVKPDLSDQRVVQYREQEPRCVRVRPDFGPGRGVTYLNFLSNQFYGFHAVVVPGTLRDSLYILEGLLEQQTSLRPTELMTDTAGYTDIVVGCSAYSATSSAPASPASATPASGAPTEPLTTAHSTGSPATA